MMWIVGLGRQPFEDFSAIRDHRDIAKAAIPFAPKGMKGAIPECRLIGTPGHEITAANLAPPTAAASGHYEFEAAR